MAVYPENPPTRSVAPAALRRDEGSSRKLRARAIIFMVVALGAGLTAAWMVMRYVAKAVGAQSPVPISKVVVAAVDIPLATTLKPDMLKVVDWPDKAKPQGTFADVNALDGRVSGVALVAGEAVVEARLSAKGSGVGMAALIPANMRAMTVQVNTVIGVSGFIHPGDLVDVITTMQTPKTNQVAGQPEYRSKIVLQNIRVLAVGEHLVTENNKPENVPAVTLLVTPEESERLALASTQGKLQLTMRSQTDNAEAPTPGISPPDLLAASSAAPVAAPPPVPALGAHHAAPARRPPPAAAAPPAASAKPVEVVEVMRGDKIEERKLPK
jgi:pilus assembly protein CpaB